MANFSDSWMYNFPFNPPPPSYMPGPLGPPPAPMPPPSAAGYAKQVRTLLDNLDASVGRVMRERDEAREQLSRARGEASATWDCVTMQARRTDTARAERDAAIERADAADKARADAEAKTVDLGWRKNRLLDAITARGFTVEWAKDGTPTLLTKEDIAKREEEAKRKEASTLNMSKLADSLKPFYGPDGVFSRYLLDSFRVITSPCMPKDKILFYGADLAKTGVINNLRFDTVTVPAKPEDRVISQQPAKPAERTAEDYYAAAIRAVWGYQVSTEAVGRASDYMKGLVDAALKRELKQHPDYRGLFCPMPYCASAACLVYRCRPWAKTA